MSLEPGQPVDRYLVVRRLGEGGMATVYLVEHNLLGSKHALKVLSPGLLRNPKVRERFLAEGRIQAQLQHPNIVRVTDIVAAEGLAALVMEYVEGPTLGRLLEDRGALPAADILAIFLPVLDAIAAAHASGVLHRDLKPSNIVVGQVGGIPRPVVLDFGIARVTEDANDGLQPRERTRDGAHLGTPAWMSPEQVRGQSDLDERSDVFSLGAILYEMAMGRTAFEADSEFDTMNNVVTGRWEAPLEPVPGDLRGTIRDCIGKALQTEREERFQSVEEFRAALIIAVAPVLDPTPTDELESITSVGAPVTVSQPRMPVPIPDPPEPPVGPSLPPLPNRGPPKAVLALGAAVLILALAGAGWSALQRYRAAQAEMADTVSRESARRALGMLETRQTDPVANADAAVLGAALALSVKAVSSARTPEALSVHALLKVLYDGWHLTARAWDEDAFADAESLTRGALGVSSGIEAGLARAIVAARACRLLPDGDVRRTGFCDEAEQRFETLRPAVTADDRGWMRIEHGWLSVGFLDALALRAGEAGETARREALGIRAVVTCEALRDLPPGTGVNESILPGACLEAAGHAGDFDAYYRAARWLRAQDEGPDGKLLSSNVRMIYERAGPLACRTMGFDKDNEYRRTMPAGGGADELFCAVVGLYALDCPLQGAKFTLLGALLHRDAGLPWAETGTGYHLDGKRSCYLTADVGD